MNRFFSLCACILAIPFILFAAPKKTGDGNQYISLADRPLWGFMNQQREVSVLVKDTESVAGKKYWRVEWHYGGVKKMPFYSELWYASGDSILSAGMKAFGSYVPFPRPSLVIADRSKPGDTWSAIIGTGTLSDTARFVVESIDTLSRVTWTLPAIHVKKTTRTAIMHRWFVKGKGLVQEKNEEKGGTGSVINMK